MASGAERAIAALARKQRGYVTRVQLLALGLSSRAIDWRISAGRLIRVYRGVYAVGHAPAEPVNVAAAAVLACGPGASLCRSSAVSLWGWFPKAGWRTPFEVAVPGDRRRKGITIHRASALAPRDVAVHLGIRVTSAACTILDVAPRFNKRPILARAISQARIAGHLEIPELDDVVARFPRHPGAKLLKPFLENPGNPTRSRWERAFPDWCVSERMPRPIMDTIVHGHEVDAYFPDQRVVVELDSWHFHRDRFHFENDRERDTELATEHDIPVIRITEERWTGNRRREAERLRRFLAGRDPG